MVAADAGAHVNLYDIALVHHAVFRGDAVDHFVIDRDAGAAGKAAVTEEGGLCARLLDRLADDPVDLACGDAGTDRIRRRFPRKRGDAAGGAHPFKLFF